MIHSNDDGKKFTKICKVTDLSESSGKRFNVDGIDVAVFRQRNEVYAMSNVCAHQHTSVIYESFIEDGYAVCPSHGWMFCLKDGKRPEGRRGIDSYPIEIRNGEVFIHVYEKKCNF